MSECEATRRVGRAVSQGGASRLEGAPSGVRKHRLGLSAVIVGVVLFVAATTAMNWVKYVSLRSTYAADLGFNNNAAFIYAAGRDVTYLWIPSWFKPGDFEGPSIFRTVNFSPLRLGVLIPLYRLWPRITTLMAIQSLLIAVGAFALYQLAWERLGRPGPGLLLAGSYLAHPAILHQGFNDYRDPVLGIGPGLLALWFHAQGRMLAFVLAALVMVAARSEYVFLLAAFGLLNLRALPAQRRPWLWLALPVALAALWGVVTNAYYLYLYDVPWPILHRGVSVTPATMATTLTERLPTLAWMMALPGVVALGAPEALVLALPYAVHANSVTWPGFPPHDLQHLAPAMVAVFWGFATTVVRWWPVLSSNARRVAWTRAVLLVAAGASLAHFGVAVAREYFVGGIPMHPEIARLADELPPDATVLVPHELVARFSHHVRVIRSERIPTPRRLRSDAERRQMLAAIVAVADLVAVKRDPALEDVVNASNRFRPAHEVSGFRLFILRDDVPRSATPDQDLQRGLRWTGLRPYQRRWVTLHHDE